MTAFGKLADDEVDRGRADDAVGVADPDLDRALAALGEAHGARRGRRGRALVEAGAVVEVPLVARDAAGSAEPEAEASSTTSAPGSTGLGVAVSFATERGAQLAGGDPQRPAVDPADLGVVGLGGTTSRQSPCWSRPAIALRSPSALNVPVYGPRGRSRLVAAGSATSSVPVKDWPAVPRPASTSGTVVPSGALSASDRWLMFGWVRLPMSTCTCSTIPGSLTCAMPA